MYRKQVWNKSQTYFDGRFNSGAFFIYRTVRPSTDGKRAPLTAINLQAAGSPKQAPPTYIAKMWKLIKFRKNVIFSRNHTDVNPDDWTITKKTIRTTIHENFSKMKNLKVDRWALSLIMSGYMDLRRPRGYRRSNVGLVHDVFQGNHSRDLRNLALFIYIIVLHSVMLNYSYRLWGFSKRNSQIESHLVTYVKSSRPLHLNVRNS